MESLTRPFFHHRRKLSNVNSSNGLLFSGEDAYDGVLLGAPKSKLGGGGASSLAASRAVAVEDYGEIFGGGGSVKRGSSIPVLDLSDLDRGNGSYDSRRSNGKMDYSKIFGSFAADDDVAMSVPPYEELFGGVKKAKCDKAKARTPADKGSPLKGSECFNSSETNKGFASEASDQFLDGGKQLNMSYHKTSQQSKDGLNGTTHIAQLHAVPGFTYFVDEATCLQKTKHEKATEHEKPFLQVKTDVNHSRISSGDLSEGKPSRRAKWQVPDRQASQGLVNGKDDSSQDKYDLKPHPFKVPMRSSSSANSNDNQGHPKQAKSSSSCGPKTEALEEDSNGYLSPSDEELDLNSAAAASAAALKKAVQQAQESIRIAKELMERKKDPVQNSKSCANGSLKVKNRKEIKYDQDMNGVRNSTNEALESIISEARAFGGFDQKNVRSDKVTSSLTCRENPTVDRNVDVEKHEENAEATEEPGVGMWFTQLLNNGKNKMAALAAQLVDNRNTIFQPTSKLMHDAEETIPAKDTLERGATDSGDIDAKFDALGKAPELEKNLDKSVSGQFVQGGTGSITLMSAQEDEPTQVEHGFHRQGKCEKKLQDCEETTYDRHFEPEILENGCLANELRNIVEVKKEEEESFELEMVKKLDDVLMWQENESRLDEKENWRRQEDSCLQKGNAHEPKEDTAIENSKKKQENSQDEDVSGNRLKGYHQQQIDELRSTCSLDGAENQNISEEENLFEDIDQRPRRTYPHEGTDSMDAGADKSTESEKIEVNLEVQESENTEGETDESEENPMAGLFPEATNDENLTACESDESSLSGETPEASEANDISKQTRQLEVTDLEEDDNQRGVTGLESREEDGRIEFEEDKEEAEQAVEEASVIKEDKMFETSCFDQSVTQEHVLESIIQDISDALASDTNTKNFGFDMTVNEEKLSKLSMDTSLPKTAGLTTEEYAVESENATKASPAEEITSDCEFANINGQKEIEESDEESEFSSRPESRDGLVHESGGDAENLKEDGVACDGEVEKHNFELDNKEMDWVEEQLEPEYSQSPSEIKESEEHLETDMEMKAGQSMENYENIETSVKEEKENRERVQKEARETDFVKKVEVDQRKKEREKDRIAVERAIREARERAFAEARERAERAAVERATAEVRQRTMAVAREKLEKVSAGTKVSASKATTGAKLRAERAAVERATAEARERALEKALSQKSTGETKPQVEKVGAGKSSAASRDTGLKHSFSFSDLEGTHNESAQRRKARLERHQRIMERAAKALAEKNMRDFLAQREQAERNRLAETLDADIKRWASGKEGNLRALLSTLQYILGPDSGWQSISLTEIITTSAVKKAYRKATLYVHPDKLQQRGASIQQKYICEKVFDLLKAAWNKFNSEER